MCAEGVLQFWVPAGQHAPLNDDVLREKVERGRVYSVDPVPDYCHRHLPEGYQTIAAGFLLKILPPPSPIPAE